MSKPVIKIPANIKKAIINTSKYHALGAVNSEKVRNWLIENNLHNDTNIDQFIDSCEMGTNKPESFINFLENEATHGNDDKY